ncbi:amidohydrolase family protein [Bradyrhizobium sp.]|uniref:amidohydrolase family protein n=1 Tax=Bradyrhizobium sp. TaxID=376 RepID=UPI0039E33A83
MNVIDTHHHFLPPDYVDEVGADPIARPLVSGRVPDWSPTASIEAMDRSGVGLAVLSLSSPALESLPPERRPAVARHCNEYAANLVRDYPGRFGFFATLPLVDIDASLREVEHCFHALGSSGVCLMTNYGGRYLGDPVLAPLLAELDRRDAVIFVHPTMPEPEPPSIGLPAASLEFPFDTTRTIASLMFSGVLLRYRRLRFIFSHAGGVVPLLAARLARLESQSRFREAVPEGVIAALKGFYFDTALSADDYALPGLLRLAAPDKVLFGSDFPHAGAVIIDKALESLRRSACASDILSAIEGDNARKLFGI